MTSLEERLKQQARDQGFDRVGIAPAGPADGFEHLRAWLDEGYAGAMHYMHRHAEARRHPSSICPPVRSVVMAALQYKPAETSSDGSAPRGRVARYARSRDYHLILRERLKRVGAWLQGERPGCWARVVVDTAPLLERDFARRAGLGWFGKNTMLLDRRLGSWFVLGGLLTDVELAADPPFTTRHCGTCTACLDACPTQAFVKPYVLDSRRCISYLTIELRTSIPEELRSGLGDWVFGCDVCQEVCPWNRHAPLGEHFAPAPDLQSLDPLALLALSPTEFARQFRDTPFLRPGRGGLLRNAALVLGNTAGPEALPALERACADSDPLVREAAGWAIEQIQLRRKGSGIRDQGSGMRD
jgi:epoxyqueuosine reductase